MKKYFLIIIVFITEFTSIKGQTIVDLFKLVQAYSPSYIGDTIPDNIFKGQKYYPRTDTIGDSTVYELDALPIEGNYLRIESYFTTGQAAGRTIELRSFKTTSNKIIVVFSIVGGAHQMLWQNYIEVYEYRDKALTISKITYLPDSVGVTDFLKPNTPTSVIKSFIKSGNLSYDLESEIIKYRMSLPYDDTAITNWQQYNVAEFEWKNNKFEKKMVLEKD